MAHRGKERVSSLLEYDTCRYIRCCEIPSGLVYAMDKKDLSRETHMNYSVVLTPNYENWNINK